MAMTYRPLQWVHLQACLIQEACLAQELERLHQIQLPTPTVPTVTLRTLTATRVYPEAPNTLERSTSIFHIRCLCVGVPYISCKPLLLFALPCRRFHDVDGYNYESYFKLKVLNFVVILLHYFCSVKTLSTNYKSYRLNRKKRIFLNILIKFLIYKY